MSKVTPCPNCKGKELDPLPDRLKGDIDPPHLRPKRTPTSRKG